MEEEREKIRQGLLDKVNLPRVSLDGTVTDVTLKSTVLEEISWKKQARLSDYQVVLVVLIRVVAPNFFLLGP